MTLLSNTHIFARCGRKHMLVCFAVCGLWGTRLSSSPRSANSTLSGSKSLLSTIDSVRSVSAAGSRSVARHENTSAPPLDLRPPPGFLAGRDSRPCSFRFSSG